MVPEWQVKTLNWLTNNLGLHEYSILTYMHCFSQSTNSLQQQQKNSLKHRCCVFMITTSPKTFLFSWPLCSLWYNWPQYFNHSSFILVWDWVRSQLVYHLGLSVLDVINASLPHIPVYVVFPKVLFLVPYFSPCIPLSALISSLSLNHHIYLFMLMTHKLFSLSMHLIFLLILVTFSMLYNISPPGRLQISSHSTLLKLNFAVSCEKNDKTRRLLLDRVHNSRRSLNRLQYDFALCDPVTLTFVLLA